MASPNSPPRLHALDGLRAVAATLVLGHHLGAATVSDALIARGHGVIGFFAGTLGTSGVELFFVLSGVVLARPYLRYGRPFELGIYLRRRATRLFPPYLVAWLLAGLSMFVLSTYPTWLTFVANLPRFHVRDWLLQLGILYFGEHYNFAWWSLDIEILFYAFLPLLVPLFLRLHGYRMAIATLACSVLGAFLVQVGIPAPLSPLPHVFRSLLAYSPCFVAGLLMSRMDFPRVMARSIAIVGGALLLIGSVIPQFPGRHIGYGLVYCGIVSRALDVTSRSSHALSKWHLVWLGERSYSLFLSHGSVLVLVGYATSMFLPRGLGYIVVTRIASVPLSLIVAMLIFSYVERRFAHGLVTRDAFWPRAPTKTPAPVAQPALGPQPN
jgi:peptidoglycan/LPS O-acetylase OafA/YrhL